MKNYYCGADTHPRWLRKILSIPFNDVCMLHDIDYETKNYSKLRIDLIFFFNLTKFSVVKVLHGVCGLFLAPFYFLAVLLFSRRSWLRSS